MDSAPQWRGEEINGLMRNGSVSGFWFVFDRVMVLLIGVLIGGFIGHGYVSDSGGVVTRSPVKALKQVKSVTDCGSQISPRIVNALRGGRPLEIGVFGDSFGDGLWAALYTQLRGDKSFNVRRFAKEGTGFTRYQTVNLLDDTRDKIAAQPIDIAVISIGANDTQGIWAHGKVAPYLGAAWQAEIGARADAVVKLLHDRGVMVYWVGLPRMREAKYDAQIQGMNDFYATRMCAEGVPFTDTVPLSVDDKGNFTPVLKHPKTGEPFHARANDGIHMSMVGYSLFTKALAERFRVYSAQSGQHEAMTKVTPVNAIDSQGPHG